MPPTSRLVNVEQLKQEIAEVLSLSAVAERLCNVQLQRSGNQWQGLCPIHNEDSPSFYVNDGRGLYHCFGCKAGGDSIDLVRRVRNLGFIEALYLLSAEADVEIEQYERPLTEEELFRERFRANCETWLSSLSAERVTRVQTPTAVEFGVGWAAGTELDGVEDYLTRGVIFPYRMPNGRLVGWKARALDSKQMFGTPNNFPLHEETLFGIQVAREHLGDGRIVIVEGEYDCLVIHQEGVRRNVVALGGSSLTTAHVQMLENMHVREATVILDGDDGGRLAARSIAERFWSSDITVRIAVCSDGEDPDSLCKKHGDFAIDMLVRGARHALEHLLWIEWESRPRGSLSSKLEFVSWIREHYGPKLRATDESLVLQEVARWMGVPEIEVRDFVRQSDTSLQVTDSERVLLSAAIHNNAVYVDLRKRFIAADFYMVKHQRIWDVLGHMLVDGLTFDVPTVSRLCEVEGIPSAHIMDLTNVSSSNLEYHEEQVLDMSLRRAARDEAVAFKTDITDVNRTSEIVVSELTHRITERVLRKSGAAIRHIDDQVDSAMEVLHDRMQNPTEIHGLDLGTQFPEISRTLQGLQSRRLVLLSASSGVGKALALDTPIPTPHGWTAMGELRRGDVIFDEKGKHCVVTATTDVMFDRQCYRVHFSDGTAIVADADHLWQIVAGRTTKICTTKDISVTPTKKPRVCVAGALDCETRSLPIDPYVLGLWLGDGYNGGPKLYIHDDDADFIADQLEKAGYPALITDDTRSDRRAKIIRFRNKDPFKDFCTVLREWGMFRNKHIPAVYLRASFDQRMALIQGLMDSDGYIAKTGVGEFVNKSTALRDGIVELLRSVGLRPVQKEKLVWPNATSHAKRREYGPYYQVRFSPYEQPVVRLPRKLERLRSRPSVHPASTTRRIEAIESVDSVPVRCIQVDSRSHLYLAGKGMIPTHNSTMMIQWLTSLSVHQSIPCDFVSLEMDEVEILTKMASHMTGIDSMNISGGRLDKDEMKKVEFAMARIRKSPLHVWAPDGMNSVEFLLYARESVMQRHTEAFFIDYIQLTDPDPGMERDNGYTQFGHFGRMAKMKVARAMDVCVVCCAQLKREAAGKERPTKEDMGDSYALVRHADVICIMSGQEDSSTMDFWLDKNRQGLGGNVLRALIVDRATNTFREASGGAREPEYLVRL